jgi:ribonuclease R
VSRGRNGAGAVLLDTRTPHRIRLVDTAGHRDGTWVRLRLDPWTDPNRGPTGHVERVLGRDGDPATDERLVVEEYGLPSAFPAAVLAEAERCRLGTADLAGRLDLRDRFVITIDPADSKDFDDALSLRRLAADTWELAVHVADVSHFVTPDSALDREAFARGCSTYLPGRVIPMLPERLSNDLCSLNPGVDRLAFTALVRLTGAGEVRGARFAPSVIRSRRRLSYEQAFAALAGSAADASRQTGLDEETVRTVRELHSLAERLRARRSAAGALELSSAELKLRLDGSGRVAAIEPVRQDAAHRLVEECMLLANEYACRALAEAGIEQLHRVHPEPEYERLGSACGTLREAGVAQTLPTNRAELARLLVDLSAREDAAVWTATVLRALPRAEYAVDAQGHFGLAKTHYAHFTSPIRRYPDLVTHRLLKAVLAGRPAAVPGALLRAIAEGCSNRERISQRAERHLSETKRLRWLADSARRQPAAGLAAVVTEVGDRGADLYLPAYGLFGWLPRARFAGEVKAGQRLRVLPARMDAARRELELMLAPTDARGRCSPRRMRPRALHAPGPAPQARIRINLSR